MVIMDGASTERLHRILWPRVEAARKWAGLNQADFCELVQISSSAYLRYRHGIVPPLVTLCRVACVCDVSLAFFFVDVDEAKEDIAWAHDESLRTGT